MRAIGRFFQVSAEPGKSSAVYRAIPVCLALLVITLGVYLQVAHHQFLSFDDQQYVTGNPHVSGGLTGENLLWAFTSVDAFNWHPVTWLSHMADAQFYGLNPGGHHLSSVVIHIVSSLLLLFLLLRCTGSLWQSSLVAALFALHPLHVESVAWVAERKDVLSAFFGFLTLLFYAEYAAKGKRGSYLLALFCFVLGLMSKPMLVTLPVVMLLLDYWPLERYRHNQDRHGLYSLIKEKVPFFACALFSMFITVYAQQKGGSVIGLSAIPLSLRSENALIAYVKYLGKILWPVNLAVYYPFPAAIALWQVIGSLSLLLLISAAALLARRRCPYLAVGWCWFLVTLLPVIGLIQVGRQSMADRYTYLPAIGIFMALAWGVPDLVKGWRYATGALALLGVAAVTVSAAVTWQQLGYWQDSITLYRHTLEVTADNYLINYNLGVDLAERGDLDAAIGNYRAALRIVPGYLEAHNNLGFALARKGELDAAVREYQATLSISPDDPKAHGNLANVLLQKGELDGAIREFRAANRINPGNFDTHNNLGVVLANKGELDAAIREYQAALGIQPDNADAHNNLGVALTRIGDLAAAILEYRAALRINPDNSDSRNNLQITLDQKRRLDAAKR